GGGAPARARTRGPRSPGGRGAPCRSGGWPPSSAARCTPPGRCWCGPGRRSAPLTQPAEGSAAMTDPLGALRAPLTPADPDPAFAARLRARLERALGLPEGGPVAEITLTLAEPGTAAPAPA